MISTQTAADIMNCAFQKEFCMVTVDKSDFNVIVVITRTYTKTKIKRFLGKIFKSQAKVLLSTDLGFHLRGPPHKADHLRRRAKTYKTPAKL